MIIQRAAVSVFGGIQPGVIAKILTRDYFESGLVSRLLLVQPPKRAGRWDRAEVDMEVMDRYEILFRRLRALDLEYSLDTVNQPREVIFTPEGEAVWGPWYDHWQDQQQHLEGDMLSLVAKLEGMVPRFAMILSLCDFVMGETLTDCVSAEQVTRAIKLAEWFREEAMRIYAFLQMPTAEAEDLRLIERIKAKGGHITARELYLSNKSKYRDTIAAKAVLQGMVDREKLAKVRQIPGKVTRRPCDYFIIPVKD